MLAEIETEGELAAEVGKDGEKIVHKLSPEQKLKVRSILFNQMDQSSYNAEIQVNQLKTRVAAAPTDPKDWDKWLDDSLAFARKQNRNFDRDAVVNFAAELKRLDPTRDPEQVIAEIYSRAEKSLSPYKSLEDRARYLDWMHYLPKESKQQAFKNAAEEYLGAVYANNPETLKKMEEALKKFPLSKPGPDFFSIRRVLSWIAKEAPLEPPPHRPMRLPFRAVWLYVEGYGLPGTVANKTLKALTKYELGWIPTIGLDIAMFTTLQHYLYDPVIDPYIWDPTMGRFVMKPLKKYVWDPVIGKYVLNPLIRNVWDPTMKHFKDWGQPPQEREEWLELPDFDFRYREFISQAQLSPIVLDKESESARNRDAALGKVIAFSDFLERVAKLPFDQPLTEEQKKKLLAGETDRRPWLNPETRKVEPTPYFFDRELQLVRDALNGKATNLQAFRYNPPVKPSETHIPRITNEQADKMIEARLAYHRQAAALSDIMIALKAKGGFGEAGNPNKADRVAWVTAALDQYIGNGKSNLSPQDKAYLHGLLALPATKELFDLWNPSKEITLDVMKYKLQQFANSDYAAERDRILKRVHLQPMINSKTGKEDYDEKYQINPTYEKTRINEALREDGFEVPVLGKLIDQQSKKPVDGHTYLIFPRSPDQTESENI